jgi:DNA invertase Pin-like site-specific DNA recombinase
MKQGERKIALRCAVYTRVSTDSCLEQDFNSLDNQREASEAYITSQAHEGWKLVRERYDDGGFSGGSMERPALQKLLDDVRARKIDVIVVYKVDRLTRSLADFAKLVESFDAHGVSFISVTQAFNTTTSMGRLTLNMLLSFAQFEREITGERIRDKVAASKRKGIWMGGAVPLGYRVEDRALQVVESEAEFVRALYRRYLELGSVVRSRPLMTRRMFAHPFGRAEPAERPAAPRSREAISIGSYRTRSMSDGCATKGRSTTAFIRRSWTLRSGSGSSKGSPAKHSCGASPSPTIIPFLWVSSMTTAETEWAPATPPRADAVGAIMCHARRCRDTGKKPDRSSAFGRKRSRTGLPTQSELISRRGQARSTAVTSAAAGDKATTRFRSMNLATREGARRAGTMCETRSTAPPSAPRGSKLFSTSRSSSRGRIGS